MSEPDAWLVTSTGYQYVSLLRESADAAAVAEGGSVVPLYRSPTLTDAEREAVEIVLRMCGDPSPVTAPLVCRYAATLRGLLERAKPVEK